MFFRTRYRARHLLRPEGQTKPLAICYNCIRWDSNPRISSLTGSRCKCSSGIHFGTSSCTAVKDRLKHRLEVTLQAYFTILLTVFHGKKAANSYLSPQFFCFFSFSMINCLKDSDPITSTIGPKERILITISGSSS